MARMLQSSENNSFENLVKVLRTYCCNENGDTCKNTNEGLGLRNKQFNERTKQILRKSLRIS